MADHLLAVTEQELFNTTLHGFQVISVFIFCALFLVGSPYGSQTDYSGVLTINGRVAWIAMELVSPAVLAYSYFSQDPLSALHSKAMLLPFARDKEPQGLLVFVCLWMIHYLNRAVVYPLRQPSRKRMHIGIMLSACMFNAVNGYLNGRWLGVVGPDTAPPGARGWRFVLGVFLFIAGFAGNIHHDNTLMRLRSKPSTGGTAGGGSGSTSNKVGRNGSGGSSRYLVPYGSMFAFVSCPHFFCESVEWTGFAIASGSPAAWAFVLNVVCNLAPRAYFIHQWYVRTFPEYPGSRKAMIPFVF
ncbi:hypothetical protein H4217_007769 [Coemansia sp. RSA 1939]|nr:hypothetical protein H4217_007769 [Coemansia sp. RSA 1939]KAJ2610831.1 hypothetical protein EV177_003780 [Coemansia sp. RSA 1804]KAJ2689599.1 hypothetical protein GGH99_002795 [Coemansia sp. RSA 1285]